MKLEKVYFQNCLHISSLESASLPQYLQLSREMTVLIGRNGSGKTNILRLISMIEEAIPESFKVKTAEPSILEFVFRDFSIEKDLSRLQRAAGRYATLRSVYDFVNEIRTLRENVTNAHHIAAKSDVRRNIGQQSENIKQFLNSDCITQKSELQTRLRQSNDVASDLTILREDNNITFVFFALKSYIVDQIEKIQAKLEKGKQDTNTFLKEIISTYSDKLPWALEKLRKAEIVARGQYAQSTDETRFWMAPLIEQETLNTHLADDQLAVLLDPISKELNVTNKLVDTTKKIRQKIREWSFPNLGEYDFYVHQSQTGVGVGFKGKNDSIIFPYNSASAGLRWLFNLLAAAMQQSSKLEPDMLLIDEPGNNLHPSFQKQLVAAFEEICKRTQLAYSTHSVFMLNPNRILDLRVITRENDVTLIDNKPYVDAFRPIKQNLGINTFLPYFVVERANKALFLEGTSDVVVWCGISQLMRLSNLPSLDLQNIAVVSLLDPNDKRLAMHFAKGLEKEFGLIKIAFLGDIDKVELAKLFEKEGYRGATIPTVLNDQQIKTIEDLFPPRIYADAVKAIHNKELDPDKLTHPLLDTLKQIEPSLELKKSQINRKAIELIIESYFNDVVYLDRWKTIIAWINQALSVAQK